MADMSMLTQLWLTPEAFACRRHAAKVDYAELDRQLKAESQATS